MMKKMLMLVYCVCVLALLYSALVSGFNYSLDNDEFVNSQITFLIDKGFLPYKDFYSIYPPIFHLFLIPIYKLTGPSFDFLILGRLFMIFLFALKIALSFSLVRIIFGKTASLIFLPLLLLDPFTIFSSMQIRPDNLMNTLLPIGLLLLLKKPFFAGLAFSITILTLFKIFPVVFIALGVYAFFSLKDKKYKETFLLLIGFVLPILLFFLFFALKGSLLSMINYLFIYPKAVNDKILYPTAPGFFLYPNNAFVYGVSGRPLSWMYEWALPVLAGAGAFSIIKARLSPLKLILLLSLAAEFVMLLSVRSAFIQYYLPLNWIYIIFASVALSEIVRNRMIVFLIILVPFVISSTRANFERSKMKFNKEIDALSIKFKQIPIDKLVFPNLLFHKPVYPLITGCFYGDVPDLILNTYPPVETALEEKKVPYLMLSDYYLSYLKPNTVSYIKANYKKIENDPELWVRK